MPKPQHLLFILTIASTLQANIFNTQENNPEYTQTVQKDTIPARIQKLLSSHKDNFNEIQHYYVWPSPDFEIILHLLFTGIPLAIWIFCFFVNKWAGIGTAFLFLPISLAFASNAIEDYQASINPGCFCLTDTALIIVRPGGSTKKCIWIDYEFILLAKNLATGAETEVEKMNLTYELKKKLIAILYSDKSGTYSARGDSKKAEAVALLLNKNIANNLKKLCLEEINKVVSPDQKRPYDELWIIFKRGHQYLLIMDDCSVKNMRSRQDYEDLCKHLQRKLKT
ncbi:MAG: hypothetical protein AAF380_02430 [Bacteroidota bacterium]